MDDADTLTITPNYPGRLIAVALLGIAAGMSGLMLFGLTPAAYAKSLTQKSGKLPPDSKALCY